MSRTDPWHIDYLFARAIRYNSELEPTGKCFYVAGPMSGYDKSNFPAFDEARDELVAKGHTVISPADIDRVRGLRIDGVFSDSMWRDCMKIDLAIVAAWVTDVFMLRGWQSSRGAMAEHSVAKWCGREVHYQEGAWVPATKKEAAA